VDSVVDLIGRRVQAGNWSLAAKNIEDLDKTIHSELVVRKNPVSIAPNPVDARLGAVNQRLKDLKAEYTALSDALESAQKLSATAGRQAINDIGGELVSKLQLINGGQLAPISAASSSNARVIARDFAALRTANAAVRYLGRLRDSLIPAIRESQRDRAQLMKLKPQLETVLAKYGITVGGPATQPADPASDGPSTGAHPRVAGVWSQSGSGCGDQITIAQATDGVVTSLIDKAVGCNAAWVAKNLRWTSANVLACDYMFTQRPTGWADGAVTVTFTANGTTGSMAYAAQEGTSGSATWIPAG
jgi:hypothetical protein